MAGLIWFVWRVQRGKEERVQRGASERGNEGRKEKRRVRRVRDALRPLVGIAEADRAHLIGMGEDD